MFNLATSQHTDPRVGSMDIFMKNDGVNICRRHVGSIYDDVMWGQYLSTPSTTRQKELEVCGNQVVAYLHRHSTYQTKHDT